MRTFRTRVDHVALAPWVRARLDARPATVAELVERDRARCEAAGSGTVLEKHPAPIVLGALRHLVALGVAEKVRRGWRLKPEPEQESLL